jgi:hypothetical protein
MSLGNEELIGETVYLDIPVFVSRFNNAVKGAGGCF